MDDGVGAGTSEDAGEGEGGELTTSEGDGAVAGEVVTDGEGAAVVDGDGDGETLRGGCAGESDGDGDGDWAVIEAANNAAIKATSTKLPRAILERENLERGRAI